MTHGDPQIDPADIPTDHPELLPSYWAHQAKLDSWRKPLDTRWARFKAWTNMVFADHGIFRLIYSNTHRLGSEAWRSAQPAPHHIRRFARRGGRTVVSLRGGRSFGSLPLEIEACEREGLVFRQFVLRSRDLPSREHLLRALDFLDEIAYPALFHCKSGADRAGFMAVLHALMREGQPLAQARRQLSARFGHFRRGPTGVLDALFEAYARDGGDAAMSFRDWVATRYDRQAIKAGFHATGWASLLVNRILRRE